MMTSSYNPVFLAVTFYSLVLMIDLEFIGSCLLTMNCSVFHVYFSEGNFLQFTEIVLLR